MEQKKFIELIESIGFTGLFNNYKNSEIYEYKDFVILLYTNSYHFFSDVGWDYNIKFDNLESINNYFKNELRSIKLKQLLG